MLKTCNKQGLKWHYLGTNQIPKPLDATKEQQEKELEKIVIKEDMMKKSMPLPFPQALRGKKGVNNPTEILKC